MQAKIVLCKCPNSKDLYGIRIQKQNNDWHRTWAFKITEDKAKKEGYENSKITGSMLPTPEYPGCPYRCGSTDIAQCSCGKLFCWRSETNTGSFTVGSAVCPWCMQKAEYHIVNSIEVEGRGI